MRTMLAIATLASCPALAHADDPCPIQRLVGEPGYSNSFGGITRIDADRLIVQDGSARTACAPGGDPIMCGAGAVYSYRLEAGRWVDPQFIYPPDIGVNDRFGIFDLDGDRLAVATQRREGLPWFGGLHIYEIDPATDRWVEVERIPAPSVDPSPPSGFGSWVALHRDSVLTAWDSIVFLFQLGDEGWELTQTINRFDPTDPTSDSFGRAMVMNDDWAIINADTDDTLGYPHGLLYVYKRDDEGLLNLHDTLLPPIDGGAFGRPLALDGSTLAVQGGGSHFAGSIFVYELTDSGLEFRQDVTLGDDLVDRAVGIGMGLSLAGDTMLFGSWRGGPGPNERVGYVFTRGSDGLWRFADVLDPQPAAPFTLDRTIGHWAATDGRMAVLGSPNEGITVPPGLSVGAAYSFDLDCEICTPDLDADGELTIFDFLTFFNLFEDGEAAADFDGDGELTIFDFLAFQTAFDAGCA
ncbi:MAG: hypothetical protein NCW75_11005 [Phycisphaera sp.]|nr:MAG: hypothetical protein NCW75_11005 [Phycisphaera sp.]